MGRVSRCRRVGGVGRRRAGALRQLPHSEAGAGGVLSAAAWQGGTGAGLTHRGLGAAETQHPAPLFSSQHHLSASSLLASCGRLRSRATDQAAANNGGLSFCF